ncbi:MFS transporter [Reyranella sp. CPCC 100927]|uniref:MFS transporter n=1 Tax=Reyranella sp. CPCC 100927 TaxID=2599616 RepID=UPI0011B52001|nr:MFS transporter [Reyranella sp. CPCC 100927]TWT15700.1 MFS transporter [Reyranella sp. CPCC 100927]
MTAAPLPATGLDLRGRRAWTLIWGVAIAQLISWGTLYYGFAVLVVPMERELGWSRPDLNAALSIGLLTSGLCAFGAGVWIDRNGARGLMTLASITGAVLLAAWSWIGALAAFYVLWALIGVSMAGALYEPAFAAMTRVFPRDFRRAITALTLVGGFASTVFVPLNQGLIDRIGWRDTLLVMAACNLLCAALHWFLLPPLAATEQARNVSRDRTALRAALHRPAFWGLAVCFTALSLVFTAVVFHLMPLMLEGGLSMATIVSGYAVIGPMQVAGRLLFVWLSRSFSTRLLGTVSFALYPVAIAVLMLPASGTSLIVFAVLYGLPNGIVTIVRGTIVPELFGASAYGAISGALATPSILARAAGPFLMALLWSASGDYRLATWTLLGLSLVAVVFWFIAVSGRRG